MNYDLLNSKCKHFQRSTVYIASHEIAVHYSHNNAERLVGVHIRYAKSAKGDTDLIVLGEDKIKGDDLVKQAILENLKQYKANGFGKVVYLNKQEQEEVLFDGGKGPTYRAIRTGRISFEQSLALRKISGEFSGATGDQSYSEAISKAKIVVYETQPWKKAFLEDMVPFAHSIDKEGKLERVMELLGSAENPDEYDELAVLLQDGEVQKNLGKFQQAIKEHHDLESMYQPVFEPLNHCSHGSKSPISEIKQKFNNFKNTFKHLKAANQGEEELDNKEQASCVL